MDILEGSICGIVPHEGPCPPPGYFPKYPGVFQSGVGHHPIHHQCPGGTGNPMHISVPNIFYLSPFTTVSYGGFLDSG